MIIVLYLFKIHLFKIVLCCFHKSLEFSDFFVPVYAISLVFRTVSYELGPKETTGPTGSTQQRDYSGSPSQPGGPTYGRAAACRRRLAERAAPRHEWRGLSLSSSPPTKFLPSFLHQKEGRELGVQKLQEQRAAGPPFLQSAPAPPFAGFGVSFKETNALTAAEAPPRRSPRRAFPSSS